VYRGGGVGDPVSTSYIVAVVRSGGLEELKRLLRMSSAEYGVWSDGVDLVVLRKEGEALTEVVGIPRYGAGFEALNQPVGLSEIVPTPDLMDGVKGFVEYVKRSEGLGGDAAAEEALKLLLIKALCEVRNDVGSAWVSNDEYLAVVRGVGETLSSRVGRLIDELSVYGLNLGLRVGVRSVAEFLRRFSRVSVLRSDDVGKVEFIQSIARKHINVKRDGTLTPIIVADLMVGLVRPGLGDLVIDPACGSGTLIVSVVRYLRRFYGLGQYEVSRFVRENAICIDVNPALTQLAAAATTLCAGHPVNTLVANSLSDLNELQGIAVKNSVPEKLMPREGGFDVVLTHPPLGVKWRVRDLKAPEGFELSFRWRYDKASGTWEKLPELLNNQLLEVLFLDRCYQLLKPYGRMAILLSEEILTSGDLGYVRQWIIGNSRVLAVISLPHYTFVPFGQRVRAFILVLQKVPKDYAAKLVKSEYKVFTSSIEKIGYDALGNKFYRKGDGGVVLTDDLGTPIVDSDVDQVISEFHKYLEGYVGITSH